jgi:hypothetical protein
MNIAVPLPHWTITIILHITPLSSTIYKILRVDLYIGVSWSYLARVKKWRENPQILQIPSNLGRKKPRQPAEAKNSAV